MLDDTLLKAREELRQTEEMQVSVSTRVHQNDLEVKQIEVAKDRMKRQFDTEMARMKETYEQLEAALRQYQTRLVSLIGAAPLAPTVAQ